MEKTDKHSFEANKHFAEEKLKEISGILADYGFQERIEAAQSRLQHEKMHILVVGEFSRGKSTFINAILRKPVLPSKVNPTTATISIIEGSDQPQMNIMYRSGERMSRPLPDEKVNKFLEEFITTSNQEANAIQEVRIGYPGVLQTLQCDIVDTPGVNDLDDLREEVTFHYLSKADSCIVLLDSQQPLSESERRFLQEKVLANDINRFLFVINRIDEVENVPQGEVSARLKAYVRKLLQEHLPQIQEPIIHSVSAKEALRARFKQEASIWESDFSNFETSLMDFVSRQAVRDRLPMHYDRIAAIVTDGIQTVEERFSLLSVQRDDMLRELQRMEQEERTMQLELGTFESFMQVETANLARWMTAFVREEFTKLQAELVGEASQIMTDEDVLRIKSMAGTGIRSIMEALQEQLFDYRRGLHEKLQAKWGHYFSQSSDGRKASKGIFSDADTDYLNPFISIEQTGGQNSSFAEVAASMALGGTLGFIGAALFGPIGIGAAIVGTIFLGGKLEEEKQAKEREALRAKVTQILQTQIQGIIYNVEEKVKEIAGKEMEPVREHYASRLHNRMNALRLTLQEQQGIMQGQRSDIDTQKKRLDEHLTQLRQLTQELAIRKEHLQA